MSDSITKQKLDALILTYPAGDEHTEPTRAMLSAASFACNGAPDKVQAVSDAVGSVAYFLAMVHRGEPERIKEIVSEEIGEHTLACKGQDATASAFPMTKLGVFLTVCRTLTPWRWPVAIAACSPFTSDLVIKVANLLKEIPQ